MSININHIMRSVARATEQNAKRAVQPKEVQQVVSSGAIPSNNPISTSAKTTKTTSRMSDEEYRTWIIAAAIEHIIKQRGAM